MDKSKWKPKFKIGDMVLNTATDNFFKILGYNLTDFSEGAYWIRHFYLNSVMECHVSSNIDDREHYVLLEAIKEELSLDRGLY